MEDLNLRYPNDDKVFHYSEEDQQLVLEQIKNGNKAFVGKYASRELGLLQKYVDGGEETHDTPPDSLNSSIGKVVWYNEGGQKTYGIILEVHHGSGYRNVHVVNPETGETKIYTYKYKTD